jgi:hypothetical protein
MYPNETDHTDPIEFFQRYGKTFADFKAEVVAKVTARTEVPKWKQDYADTLLHMTGVDGKPLLNDRRPADQKVEWWELAVMLQRVMGGAK